MRNAKRTILPTCSLTRLLFVWKMLLPLSSSIY